LQELIEQIQHIAGEWEKTPVVNPPKDRVRSLKDAKSAIAKLAHDENLTEIATQLEHFLNFNLVQLTCRNYEVDFDNLVNCWTSEAGDGLEPLPQKNTHNRVALFWALLLLSAQSKVELSQEEFYQDLKIKPLIIDINKNTLDKVEENFS
jgi:segregation and condensation protein A